MSTHAYSNMINEQDRFVASVNFGYFVSFLKKINFEDKPKSWIKFFGRGVSWDFPIEGMFSSHQPFINERGE